ncbi:MAG: hypothetical protein Q7T07_06365 [Burkholderiaceae bacterium]|nr:hypothetical protein [Burkholderiaceae bacterium]
MKSAYCRLVLVTALLPLILGGCAMQGVQGVASADAAKPATSRPQLPPPSALETQYGIQITQLGLTASGGLVDVRFKVLDAAKARKLLGNPANAPMLIAGDKPPLMAPHNALRGAKFGQGQVIYILYPNLRSAIKPGTEVTVAMGEARLGPVTAQ